MALLEQDEEIQEMSVVLNHAQNRPKEIKSAEITAWVNVKYSRARFLRAAREMESSLLAARRAMEQTRLWEGQRQELIQQFVKLCEKVKRKQFQADMQGVAKIRKKLGDKFQEQVTREPVLRRVMSKWRSRPPTPILLSAGASLSRPRP